MIECPWCQSEIEIVKGRCPVCKQKLHTVSESDFDEPVELIYDEDSVPFTADELDVEQLIQFNFKCSKCKGDECITKELAMTGTGLSKLLDIQYNHFLFVSCTNCGHVNVYNSNILRKKHVGTLGTTLDFFFG